MLYVAKVLISAVLIVAATEIAKKSTFWGALVIVLPISSILSITFLYLDTNDGSKVTNYAKDIFYLIPVSLLFFVPFLFGGKTHWPFWLNFASGLLLIALTVFGMSFIKK